MVLYRASHFFCLMAFAILTACGGELNQSQSQKDSLDGDGLVLIGNDRNPDGTKRRTLNIPGLGNLTGGSGQNTVNSYLWRASLDTLSPFPLATTDPFGGVIQSEWFAANGAVSGQSGQEIKVAVFILGAELKTENLRVQVFVRQPSYGTVTQTQPGSRETEVRIENTILLRARDIKIAESGQ